ncbi:c-type cytochrome biogenesis protein CcmI [Thalassospira mesophila]|uniref:Cytochrome C biogenesis protein n=1 Tax=Thalassospira mesophila TaxID=1293891 RepID=A0A1Y2L1L5_9PROT|nr:c-type cytochrome biogenesis protein CcmI [Thalassospira mesophila]OSQ39380.1 cytochrome C biogenesis protein [Thalassospira mesophila]
MTVWIVFALVTVAVAGYVLWPLLTGSPETAPATPDAGTPDAGTSDDGQSITGPQSAAQMAAAHTAELVDQDELQRDLTVYRDQLSEITRDIDRGVLNAEQAEAARTEVQRRILATDQRIQARAARRIGKTSGTYTRPVAVALILIGIIAGLGLYLDIGHPTLPDRPIAQRTDEIMAARNAQNHNQDRDRALRNAVADLSNKLIANPENLQNWELLGNSLLALNRPQEAQTAFLEAVKLSNRDGAYLAMYAEAIIRASDGQVTAPARGALEEAAKSGNDNPRIGFYLGVADLQQGHAKAAIERWITLANSAPADASWAPMVVRQIQQTAQAEGIDITGRLKPATTANGPAIAGNVGPSQQDMKAAADLTPEERRQMIEGMVGRLASKLAENPQDPDGWARLMRAYMVMGMKDKAQESYQQAQTALKDDKTALDQLAVIAGQAGIATQ